MRHPAPPFEEAMKFNETLWPLFRSYFTDGYFTYEAAEKFLKNAKRAHEESERSLEMVTHTFTPADASRYVQFISIPRRLNAIITPTRAYLILEKRTSEVELCLDNDFSYWIDEKYLGPVPPEELAWRTDYDQTSKFQYLKKKMLTSQ